MAVFERLNLFLQAGLRRCNEDVNFWDHEFHNHHCKEIIAYHELPTLFSLRQAAIQSHSGINSTIKKGFAYDLSTYDKLLPVAIGMNRSRISLCY